MSDIKVNKKRSKRSFMGCSVQLTALSILAVVLSGCSSQLINQALFSMGEQANCARANDNRVDEHSRRATCLAETSLNHDYANYKDARESELAK